MKNKFLVLAAGLTAFALASCGGNGNETTTTPQTGGDQHQTETESEQKTVAMKFAGNAVIKGESKPAELLCYEDKTFSITLEGKTTNGTYELVEGEGYKLTFDDSAETVVTTEFDTKTKSHVATFELKLGSAGKAEVTVSLKDEKFVPTVVTGKEGFLSEAVFKGVLNFGGAPYNYTLRFEGDKYFLECDQMGDMLNRQGTFTYVNNTFTLKSATAGEKEVKSTYDIATNTYKIMYNLVVQSTVDFELTYKAPAKKAATPTLTGSIEAYGGMTVDLYMNADGTALFDLTPKAGMPGMDVMFDKPATWVKSEAGHTFTIPQGEGKDALTAEMSFNQETKKYEMLYLLPGQDGNFEFNLTGKSLPSFSNFYGEEPTQYVTVKYGLIFSEENKVMLDVTVGMGGMDEMFDQNGTYTFADNTLTITFGEAVINSTWNEEAGTYTIKHTIPGNDLTLNPELTFAIWG